MSDFDPNYKEDPVLAKIGQKIIIFNERGEILFLKRSEKCTRPGGWDFPGGGIEFGEDPTKGIIREVNEETQLVISDIQPVHLESVINGHGDFVIMIGYKAKTSMAELNLSWEHDAYKWVTTEEALKIELPEIHKQFLEKSLAKS